MGARSEARAWLARAGAVREPPQGWAPGPSTARPKTPSESRGTGPTSSSYANAGPSSVVPACFAPEEPALEPRQRLSRINDSPSQRFAANRCEAGLVPRRRSARELGLALRSLVGWANACTVRVSAHVASHEPAPNRELSVATSKPWGDRSIRRWKQYPTALPILAAVSQQRGRGSTVDC